MLTSLFYTEQIYANICVSSLNLCKPNLSSLTNLSEVDYKMVKPFTDENVGIYFPIEECVIIQAFGVLFCIVDNLES